MKVVIVDYGMGNIFSLAGALNYLGITPTISHQAGDIYQAKIFNYCAWEIYLNCIDKDVTGFGYDFETVHNINSYLTIPLILASGAGNENHLLEGLQITAVNAVATANLFNFVGDGLPTARKKIVRAAFNLANWKTILV